MLDNYWNLKKKLSNEVTSSTIDEIYKEAKISGAQGGKIIGAGGGGFIFILC